MMFQLYINFILLIFIAVRLNILTDFGVKLFSILSVVAMFGHEFSKLLEKGDKKR